jgi:hypothetical protein
MGLPIGLFCRPSEIFLSDIFYPIELQFNFSSLRIRYSTNLSIKASYVKKLFNYYTYSQYLINLLPYLKKKSLNLKFS